MNVRNCKRCGRIFTYTGKAICNYCIEEEQQDFDKVREYLFKHPNSTTIEVGEATGVEIKVITRFLKEGRLESEGVTFGDAEELTCESCNRPIRSGRFCEACIKELQGDFQKASETIGTKPNSNSDFSQMRVHTYDNFRKK